MNRIAFVALIAFGIASTGCGFNRMVAKSMAPGEIRCTSTSGDYNATRTCYIRDGDELVTVSHESCVVRDGEVTACTSAYR